MKIPKSKARTAYGLLSEVCKIIRDEPKRYNQLAVLVKQDNYSSVNLSYFTKLGFPSCGTVGCVAGWVHELKGNKNDWVLSSAGRILGLINNQVNEFFNENALHELNKEGFEPQTKEYAELGVQHIQAFQEKYKKQLLAKKV